MTPFYQQLLQLNHENQALWNGEHGGEIQVLSPATDTLGFAFYRAMNEDEVLCVFNFSAEERTVQFDNPSTNSLTELFNEGELVAEQGEITLPAWGFAVYHNE
jgi:glycosidase